MDAKSRCDEQLGGGQLTFQVYPEALAWLDNIPGYTVLALPGYTDRQRPCSGLRLVACHPELTGLMASIRLPSGYSIRPPICSFALRIRPREHTVGRKARIKAEECSYT